MGGVNDPVRKSDTLSTTGLQGSIIGKQSDTLSTTGLQGSIIGKKSDTLSTTGLQGTIIGENNINSTEGGDDNDRKLEDFVENEIKEPTESTESTKKSTIGDDSIVDKLREILRGDSEYQAVLALLGDAEPSKLRANIIFNPEYKIIADLLKQIVRFKVEQYALGLKQVSGEGKSKAVAPAASSVEVGKDEAGEKTDGKAGEVAEVKASDVDFSFIKDDATRHLVKDAYKAVSSIDGAWDFLKSYTPEKKNGYMFSKHPMLDQISQKLDPEHSGFSYAFTMNQIDYIAKNGLEAYKKIWVNKEKETGEKTGEKTGEGSEEVAEEVAEPNLLGISNGRQSISHTNPALFNLPVSQSATESATATDSVSATATDSGSATAVVPNSVPSNPPPAQGGVKSRKASRVLRKLKTMKKSKKHTVPLL